jgi:hypothetical protein
MAPLPKSFDVEAMRLRVQLHRARRFDDTRETVKQRCAEILAQGGDRPEIQRLHGELTAQQRGRPRFGAKYLWLEIGDRNEELRDDGEKYEVRLEILAREFGLKDLSKIKTILAKYKRAMEEYDAIDRERYAEIDRES